MRQDALSAVSRLLRGDSRGAKAGPSSSPITWRNRLQMPREKMHCSGRILCEKLQTLFLSGFSESAVLLMYRGS
jgi:hypothetical protein